MPRKIVTLTLDSEEYPMLFKINQAVLGPIIADIFKTGYDAMFPQPSNINVSSTDTLKYDIKCVQDSLNKVAIDKRLDKFETILDDLIGISKTSYKKGLITENMIHSYVEGRFPDYTIETTRNLPHSGDYIIHMPIKGSTVQVLLEVKNYIKAVDKPEIDKLMHDMLMTGIRNAIIVSMQTGFIGRTQLEIVTFENKHGINTIVFVPYLNRCISVLEASIVMMSKLVTIDAAAVPSYITTMKSELQTKLKELEGLYTDYNRMKINYSKMEINIREQLNIHHLFLQEYGMEVNKKIHNVWRLVDESINNYTAAEYSNTNSIIDTLKSFFYKHHMILEPFINNSFQILTSDTITGTIIVSKQRYDIVLFTPQHCVSINKDATKKSVGKLLSDLDTFILERGS